MVEAGSPSYNSSMTSQLMLVSTVAYLMAGGVLLYRGNIEGGIAVFAGVFTAIKGLYDQRKSDQRMKNGIEPPVEPIKPALPSGGVV